MQAQSVGEMLPRVLFPYLQEWAERAGLSLLSQLLVDEDFRGLIEKYGNELLATMTRSHHTESDDAVEARSAMFNSATAAKDARPSGDPTSALVERILALEAQQDAQQALFKTLRTKIRPLASALGCCPECLVGVDVCPNCWGKSRVGLYAPDCTLLQTKIIDPLGASGLTLTMSTERASRSCS
jgi:hypothetical protein